MAPVVLEDEEDEDEDEDEEDEESTPVPPSRRSRAAASKYVPSPFCFPSLMSTELNMTTL